MPGKTIWIALFRGINVGGNKKVNMRDLSTLIAALPAQDVTTYVQSGNVIFKSVLTDRRKLARLIADRMQAALGFSAPVLLLTVPELGDVIRQNPFAKTRGIDPAVLHVTFLSDPPAPEALAALKVYHDPVDEFSPGRQAIYLRCPNGYGRTKLNNAFLEKKLGVPATTRNWKTATTLLQMGQ